MATRYAGDIFYRPMTTDDQREYIQGSVLKRMFPDIRTMFTPGQKQFQQQYVEFAKQYADKKSFMSS